LIDLLRISSRRVNFQPSVSVSVKAVRPPSATGLFEKPWLVYKLGMRTGMTAGHAFYRDPHSSITWIQPYGPAFPAQINHGLSNNNASKLGCNSTLLPCTADVVASAEEAAAKGWDSRIFGASGSCSWPPNDAYLSQYSRHVLM